MDFVNIDEIARCLQYFAELVYLLDTIQKANNLVELMLAGKNRESRGHVLDRKHALFKEIADRASSVQNFVLYALVLIVFRDQKIQRPQYFEIAHGRKHAELLRSRPGQIAHDVSAEKLSDLVALSIRLVRESGGQAELELQVIEETEFFQISWGKDVVNLIDDEDRGLADQPLGERMQRLEETEDETCICLDRFHVGSHVEKGVWRVVLFSRKVV